ncbi:MAG: hypothetical protein QOI12_2171 [Alphaproteobacteria bacterium]|nr:hypothetical protein [Alphaproteobacteria bacterium]
MTTAHGRVFDLKAVRVSHLSRGPRRSCRDGAAGLLLLAGLAFGLLSLAAPRPAAAQAVKGEVSAVIENGFARLVFLFAEEIETQVRLANGIVTVSFARPVEISVDRINANTPGFVSAARRDPDGKAVRIAMARKVTLNTIVAGERLFVDLLPDTWTGMAPGLPRDVIEVLARRARDAERKVRAQRTLANQSKMAPIRVRAVAQPTFTRYVFELPDLIGVSADNTKDKLTLTFDALLKFDLADAKATLPAVIEAIDSELDQDSVLVRFSFGGKVDVRTFREDNSYVVDVSTADMKAAARPDGSIKSDELAALANELTARKAAPVVEPPQTVPARPAPSAAPDDKRPPAQTPPPKAAQPPAVPRKPSEAAVAAEPALPPPMTPAPRAAATRPAPAAATVAPPVVSTPAVASASDTPVDPSIAVNAGLKRSGENLTLTFAFANATPAAVFRRADVLWLVFDTGATVSVAALEAEIGHSIKGAWVTRVRDVVVVRARLERPMLVSAAAEGNTWAITLGTEVVEPTRPLGMSRNIVGAARSSITIPIEDPRDLYRIEDPEAGDTLLVVTALGPARGFLKTQDFVEFRMFASTHGVVMQPFADDLNAELSADKIIVTRPAGLTLSATTSGGGGAVRGAAQHRHVLDTQSWGFDRQADFTERKSQLMMAAADAPDSKRSLARADLARFYLARDMPHEAKAVLDVALAETPPTTEDSTPVVLRAVCNIMMGRADAALKDLAHPFVGNQHDAPLWRALAYARLGKWTDARAGFRNAEVAMGTLPLELQRTMMKEIIRASIEVGDVTSAASEINEFEQIGIPRELEPTMSVLAGRLSEGLGRMEDARRSYATAAVSWDRPAAAQGRLREIVLRRAIGDLKRAEAIAELESLTMAWRGDDTEAEAMQLLARLYTEDGRFRDAFQVMRSALTVHPNSEVSRRIQDEAAATFDALFLAGKGDALPAIDALALFYDYRELTPIGRRGDEMIRRLADRLVSVDLLDQAAELLQHQVDHRLQGAARAQVASRLAVVYLMNHKTDRALATLRASRTAELPNELRNQRLLLEARALSESGRHDVALEVVANVPGREAIRLRADIHWAAKRWAPAAEQIEVLYGDRWQEFEPLAGAERTDVMRAAIGYALGEDAIGLGRFRERYAAKMGEGPERRAFDVVTSPIGASGTEFRDIARSIATVDTLETFLRDLRARYPETGTLAIPPRPPPAEPVHTSTPRSDPATTGSAPQPPPPPRLPPPRTAAR